MNAAGVIALASVHGVRLSSTGVCVVATPSSKLTDELRREIRANKTELLQVLTQPTSVALATTPDLRPAEMPRQDDRRPSDSDAPGCALSNSETVEPTAPCHNCGTGQWWHLPTEPWHCRQCKPLSAATAHSTTLTLSCHQIAKRPVRAHAQLDAVLATACQGLSISPSELRQELADDLDAIASGELRSASIRLSTDAGRADARHSIFPISHKLLTVAKNEYAQTHRLVSKPSPLTLATSLDNLERYARMLDKIRTDLWHQRESLYIANNRDIRRLAELGIQTRVVNSLLLLAVVCTAVFFTRRFIVTPINRLAAAASAVAAGDLGRTVAVTSKDEIGRLQSAGWMILTISS